jgi:acetylornithine/N-succinyldiaminopimelate aminotransferase
MMTAHPTSALMDNYGSPSLEFARGNGCELYTQQGQRYLDFAAGIAVTCLGHCHPVLIDALAQQSQRLWHTSNLYRIEQAERLGARLVENSFADKVFFCNSGAEAIEASYKTIRRYFFAKGQPHRNRIVSLSSAFHGRTLGAIASAFNSAHCDGFVVGDAGFDQAPFGDLDALLATITDNTAGIVLEPVQGEGGIRPADRAYLKAVRELCDDKGILLLFDEVQCGIARTGTLFAYEQLGVEPDILASAKGLGGGIPIGACLAREEIAAAMRAGSHGSTFGGNPLATAVGNAVLDVVLNDDFLIDVKHAGFHLRSGLEDLCARFPEQLKGVTGLGLMIGLQCHADAAALIQGAQDKSLLLVKAGGNSIRFLPPLIVSHQEINEALAIFEQVLNDHAGA